jgi:hypothetical protein
MHVGQHKEVKEKGTKARQIINVMVQHLMNA